MTSYLRRSPIMHTMLPGTKHTQEGQRSQDQVQRLICHARLYSQSWRQACSCGVRLLLVDDWQQKGWCFPYWNPTVNRAYCCEGDRSLDQKSTPTVKGSPRARGRAEIEVPWWGPGMSALPCALSDLACEAPSASAACLDPQHEGKLSSCSRATASSPS